MVQLFVTGGNMKFSTPIAGLLAVVLLAGCGPNESPPPSTESPPPVVYPSVDDSFLSATEWRFIGPYRGGRVLAVAGVINDPLVHYFGAAHGRHYLVR